jgi:hypothetical protein
VGIEPLEESGMRPHVLGPLVIASLLVASGCETGDGGTRNDDPPLSAGQRAPDGGSEEVVRDQQGGGHGVERPATVAEHTLGEDRGFVVTASLEEQQVCLTATPTGADGDTAGTAAVTACGVPDTPLDLRVLVLGDDLAVLVGVVTDDRAADVLLLDRSGEPVPDEADAVPLVDVPGSDHRAFAAASDPSGLSEVQLADAEGGLISEKPVPR